MAILKIIDNVERDSLGEVVLEFPLKVAFLMFMLNSMCFHRAKHCLWAVFLRAIILFPGGRLNIRSTKKSVFKGPRISKDRGYIASVI